MNDTVETTLRELLARRILVLDGAMGTMVQRRGVTEADYRGARFERHPQDLKGNTDVLVLTRPDVHPRHPRRVLRGRRGHRRDEHVRRHVHRAGRVRPGGPHAFEMNVAAARIAKESAREWTKRTPGRPRFVAGSIGPAQQDALALAERGRSRVSRRHLRPGARRLRRAGARAHRGRRRHPARRDHLRHAQRQGGARRHRGGRSTRSACGCPS